MDTGTDPTGDPGREAARMMKGTPRTFVGSMVLLLEEPVDDETAAAVSAEVEQMDSISYCHLDPTAGTIVLTAQSPVDRNDLVAILDRLGCRIRP